MKKIMSIVLAAVLSLGIIQSAFAIDNITVTIDGEEVVFDDQQPVNINGRVMVPVRAVAEQMGWEVSFEKYPGNTIVDGHFQEESHVFMMKNVDEIASVNRKFGYLTNITLERGTILSGSNAGYSPEEDLVAKPVVQNGRTLLGIRDIAEGLYADVRWDGATKTVIITTKPVEQFPNYDKLMEYIDEYRGVVKEQNENTAAALEAEKNSEVKLKEAVEEARSGYVDEMLRLVNKEREEAGIAPLELDDTLTKAASIRAKEICEVFDHTRPNGENFRSILKEMGTSTSYVGENINRGTFESPESAMKLWMSSETHRSNILNPNYKYIGIGYTFESESNGVFDDTISNWVQIFAE